MNRTRARNFTNSSYRTMQLGLAPELRGLRDHEIEAFVEEQFSGLTAEEVENFAKSLRSFGQAAAPIAQRALPGVISGATTGAVAGPWGAVIGGVVGGTASLLATGNQQGQAAPARPLAPRPQPSAPPATPPRPAATPRPHATPRPNVRPSTTRAGSSPQTAAAAAQLISLLARPEVQRALMALLMGNAGRRTVRVGGQNVPIEMMADELASATAFLSHTARNQAQPALEGI